MIEISDLKKINILKPLDDKRLERLRDLASLESTPKGHFFFHAEDTADKIYSVLSGRVGLAVARHRQDEGIDPHTWVVEIGPSNSFGVSAAIFIADRRYMTCAKALTSVKALSWRGEELKNFFEEDFELGYRFMSELARVVKERLMVKNIQFTDIYSSRP